MGILKHTGARKWIPAAIWMVCAVLRAEDTRAETILMDEEKIKAGLIYNLLKYTDWPEDRAAPENRELEICLFGDSELNAYLAPMQGRTAQQFTIRIVRKTAGDDVSSCNVVFIDDTEESRLREILGLFAGRHVLTASDIPRFSARGGMVELSTGDDSRIHLYINRGSVRAAGIGIQPRLANLAEKGGAP